MTHAHGNKALLQTASQGRKTRDVNIASGLVTLGGAATQVTFSDGGNIYVLGTTPEGPDKFIYEYTNNQFYELPGQANYITTGPGDTLYAVTSAGNGYKYLSSGFWQPLGGGIGKLAIDVNQDIFATSLTTNSSDSAIFEYSLASQSFVQIPGIGFSLASYPDQQNLWVVQTSGNLFQTSIQNISYTLCPGQVTSVATMPQAGYAAVMGYPLSSNTPVYGMTQNGADCSSAAYNQLPLYGSSIAASSNGILAIIDSSASTDIIALQQIGGTYTETESRCSTTNTCNPNCPGQVDTCTNPSQYYQFFPPTTGTVTTPVGNGTPGKLGPGGPVVGNGTRSSRIFARAQGFLNYPTLAIANKINGTACAYMVNLITAPITGVTLSNWVPDAVNTMDHNPQFQKIDPSNAVPGDIVVKDGDGPNPDDPHSPSQSHIGICATYGCTEIYSNSDSNNKFMNNYHGGPDMDTYHSTVYHVKGN